MMWGYGMHPFGMMFGGWIFMALLVGLVVWLALGQRSYRHPGSDESLAILKRRLAGGEINEEDYNRLKELLK